MAGQHRAADGDGVGLARADPINYGRWHMGMVSEFKEFIARGNVLDLAVAVVIGAAFGKIVTALVDGIIMPVVGMAMGGADFSQLFVALNGEDYANLAAAQAAAAPVVTYGRSEEHTSELQSLMRISYAVFCLKKKITSNTPNHTHTNRRIYHKPQ